MVSHFDTASGDTARDCERVRIVVVDREPLEAASAIDDVMVACRVKPRRVSPGAPTEYHPDDWGIALVAIREEPLSHSPVLDDIHRLKANGFTVLCYAKSAAAWPIGARCRLLLSGASDLFDSSAPGFARELCQRLHSLLEAARDSDREAQQLRQQMLDVGIIGSGPRITAGFRSIVRVSAVSDLSVLITGETGTGKELAARAIHHWIDGAAIGRSSRSTAARSARGWRRASSSATGAARSRARCTRARVCSARRAAACCSSTRSAISISALQAKLLRVLQEGRVLAVGDDHERPIDVRVVAATNRDLEEMVRQHTFRADLFHRLNVLTVRVPALRDRREDIAPLVEHFVARHGVSASPEFVDALRHLDLPGNIRQLENVVWRAVANATPAGQLRLCDLPPEFWLELTRTPHRQLSGTASGAERAAPSDPAQGVDITPPLDPVAILEAASWKLESALDLCEQQLVAAALGQSRGNRSRAARLLGISPRCIFNKMRKHRLSA